jgi:uncharacterized damage-inducible protein DinB
MMKSTETFSLEMFLKRIIKMSETNPFGAAMLKEMEAEVAATRKCLERIPVNLFDFKPHEKSMPLGYLAILVAEMPRWISHMIESGDIDLATFGHFQPKDDGELAGHFVENVEGAKRALQKVTDEILEQSFSLKNQGEVLFTDSKRDSIEPIINHMVHHRGQLTVYMRLNDIPVPSLYGPSADDQGF